MVSSMAAYIHRVIQFLTKTDLQQYTSVLSFRVLSKTNLSNKMWSRLLVVIVIVIVLFVVALREMIIMDSNGSMAFGSLRGTLPFAKQAADIICKVIKYQ